MVQFTPIFYTGHIIENEQLAKYQIILEREAFYKWVKLQTVANSAAASSPRMRPDVAAIAEVLTTYLQPEATNSTVNASSKLLGGNG